MENAPGRFLAAGFRKPHMPWRFPRAFLKYYLRARIIMIETLA
jgi:hypothetical protein